MQNELENMTREQLLEVAQKFQGQAIEFQEKTLQKQATSNNWNPSWQIYVSS